jgi:hypothetical protein
LQKIIPDKRLMLVVFPEVFEKLLTIFEQYPDYNKNDNGSHATATQFACSIAGK